MDKRKILFFGFCTAFIMPHNAYALSSQTTFLTPSTFILLMIIASFCALVFKHAGNKTRIDIERIRKAIRE